MKSSSNTVSGVSVSGVLRLRIYDIDGNLIKELVGSNLVVNSGIQVLLRVIGGSQSILIDRVAVGTGVEAAKAEDTSLTDPQYFSLEGFPVTYYNNNVIFNFIIDFVQAVGVVIGEFGLFTSDGVLFSRKVVEPFEKTATISVVGEWIITLEAPEEEPGDFSYDFSSDFN